MTPSITKKKIEFTDPGSQKFLGRIIAVNGKLCILKSCGLDIDLKVTIIVLYPDGKVLSHDVTTVDVHKVCEHKDNWSIASMNGVLTFSCEDCGESSAF